MSFDMPHMSHLMRYASYHLIPLNVSDIIGYVSLICLMSFSGATTLVPHRGV